MPAEPIALQGIAGGFVLVPVREIMSTWRACRRSPLGAGAFRTWLACHEIVARRCTSDDSRSPNYGFAELARLTNVSQKRAKASVARLVAAGLLVWSDQLIEFPESSDLGDDTLTDTIGGGKGSLAIPRRMLRLLIRGAKPALIATVLAILLRCLSKGRGGFKSRGRIKASWIACVFDVDVRRVKQARKELIALGWLTPETSDQWAMNRWGRAYTIDLIWERATAAGDEPRLPPLPTTDGPRLPPPDLHPKPLRENKNQKPDPGGPAGVEIQKLEKALISSPTFPATPATIPLQQPAGRNQESTCRRPTLVADGAGTSPGRVEPGRTVPQQPAVVTDGIGGRRLPAPRLDDVRVEDLKDTGRLLVLLDQAIARELVSPSEADRLRFVAAAEHAMGVGKGNPAGLFCHLIRGRLWRYLGQADEDLASLRLKRHQFGGPREIGVGLRLPLVGPPRPSSDAELVGEVRAAWIRAGHFRDPFPEFRARNLDWSRERWDRALSELGLPRSGN